MSKLAKLGCIPMALAIIAITGLIALLLIKLLWAWTIPDLFPGAVDQGLVARDISWLAAFKLALFIAVIAGITGIKKNKD
jgi:hypothetical protein